MYDSTGSARVPVGRGVQLAAVEELLTDEEVEAVCRQLAHQWQVRVGIFRGQYIYFPLTGRKERVD